MNALVKLAVLCGAAAISFAPATAAHADEPSISLNTGSGWTHDPEQSLFDFSRIAPGWTGSAVVGVRNDSTTTATVTLSSSNAVEDENGCNHPESYVDTTCSDPRRG